MPHKYTVASSMTALLAMPDTVEAGTSKCYESANNMNSRQIVKTKKINKKYMCATCSISFDNSSALNVHLKNVHANKEFWEKCFDCSKSFASYASLKIHRHKKHNSPYEKNFYCTDDNDNDSFCAL
jgi:DNA-directed RNA polymerase subunit RPC12/RpoP